MTPSGLLAALWGEGWHSLCYGKGDEFRVDGCYDDAEALLDRAADLTAAGCNVWFGVHPLAEKPAKGRGGAADVECVIALCADLDWDDPEAHADAELPTEAEVRNRLALFSPAPSVVVCSGHGLQAFWLLRDPVDAGEGEVLTEALHAALEDAGMPADRADLASVLRVPGSFNFKAKPIEVVIESGDLDRRYVPENLVGGLPTSRPMVDGVTRRQKAGPVSGRGLTMVLERLEADDRHQDAEALKVLCNIHGGHDPFLKGTAGIVHVTRPGKKAGTSATIGYVAPGVVKMFSANWPGFERQRIYSLNGHGFVDQANGGAVGAAGSLGESADSGSHVSIELIDWSTIHDRPDEIVSGLIIPGRWTALAAPAKAGKSLLLLYVTVAVSQGCDPFDGTTIDPVTTLYVDAEMGRHDLAERLGDLGVDPLTLDRWHATDLPPRLGTPEGGAALVVAAQQLGAGVVVIDGINGTVDGAENDDTTWRPFYDYTVSPLKRLGVAVVTGDNLGKDKTLGPRGSSVKIDKPDAVLSLSRTDDGVRLAATHRRTSAYPDQRHLRIEGVHDTRVVRYRDVDSSWPSGTEAAAKLLDDLGVPVEHGRTKVRRALADAGETMSNTTLTAAIRWRQRHADRGQK